MNGDKKKGKHKMTRYKKIRKQTNAEDLPKAIKINKWSWADHEVRKTGDNLITSVRVCQSRYCDWTQGREETGGKITLHICLKRMEHTNTKQGMIHHCLLMH